MNRIYHEFFNKASHKETDAKMNDMLKFKVDKENENELKK